MTDEKTGEIYCILTKNVVKNSDYQAPELNY